MGTPPSTRSNCSLSGVNISQVTSMIAPLPYISDFESLQLERDLAVASKTAPSDLRSVTPILRLTGDIEHSLADARPRRGRTNTVLEPPILWI
jgi:hypothetical protein